MKNENEWTPQHVVAGSSQRRPTEAILGSGYELLITATATGGAYELMKFVVPDARGHPDHGRCRRRVRD